MYIHIQMIFNWLLSSHHVSNPVIATTTATTLQILPYLSAIHCSQLYGFVHVAVKRGGWIEIASMETREALRCSRPLRGPGIGPEFHELDRIGTLR